MLRLQKIVKDYKVGDQSVNALKGVDISFRKNEFVAILGPSGCGKTTLLNIIGGLDKYTFGDLYISGKSTRAFDDRDWDVYRNHRVGFVFQSYNLIPHQTVLGNVELALTIAGLTKKERVSKAKDALDKVGLSDQYKKRPNQLSGGQCQRVAIARALVNDPEILLADEPTGALDSVTSVQIMDIIREVSGDKLVIMVTHNPDLADVYANRIIKLSDGLVIDDTNPFSSDEEISEVREFSDKKDHFFESFIIAEQNYVNTLVDIKSLKLNNKQLLKELKNKSLDLDKQEVIDKQLIQNLNLINELTNTLVEKKEIYINQKKELNNFNYEKIKNAKDKLDEALDEIDNKKKELKANQTDKNEYAFSVKNLNKKKKNLIKNYNILKNNPNGISTESAKMSFYTAFKLSLHNLVSKRGRTSLVAVAGSIGIIGVSLVLSFSYGVQHYITSMQDDMLSGNPISIEETTFDLSSMMSGNNMRDNVEIVKKINEVGVSEMVQMLARRAQQTSNILVSNTITKEYVDYVLSLPSDAVASIFLDYGINVTNNIFTDFKRNGNSVETSLTAIKEIYSGILKTTEYDAYSSFIESIGSGFAQAPSNEEYILSQYNLLDGNFANDENELMLVVSKDRQVTDLLLAQLGFLSQEEFLNLMYKTTVTKGEESPDYDPSLDIDYLSFEKIREKSFYWYPNDSIFTNNGISYDYSAFNPDKTLDGGIELKIVGILEPKDTLSYGTLSSGFYYTEALTKTMLENNLNSEIVTNVSKFPEGLQMISSGETVTTIPNPLYDNIRRESEADFQAPSLKSKEILEGILNGDPQIILQLVLTLGAEGIEALVSYPYYFTDNLSTKTEWVYDLDNDTWSNTYNPIGTHNHIFQTKKQEGIMFKYDFSYTDSKGTISKTGEYGYLGSKSQMSQMLGLIGNFMPGFGVDIANNTKILTIRELGGLDIPASIYIYPINFELKAKVIEHLDAWNTEKDITYFSIPQNKEVTVLFEDRDEIKYSDTIAIIINLINTLINMITIALVSFTSLSLVVSTVMIAIITYVSVVERTKEIGVIRSLGGRKKDVSHLFNAETFIIGLVAGTIGVGFTYLASFIISKIVRQVGNLPFDIAIFPWYEALIMIGVSILLTLISGLFPSRAAAKQDPVNALRTE